MHNDLSSRPIPSAARRRGSGRYVRAAVTALVGVLLVAGVSACGDDDGGGEPSEDTSPVGS